ncbi:MAG TPA: NnrS family protein [Usitatibacter sp.]|nr:NnrS family protein [Usitatibacter sp.]
MKGSGGEGPALLALGFRPFYLAASLFAASSIAIWALQYTGAISPLFRGPAWHGHEMLFGFTLAVIAGFLFTAVRNWTQRDTPRGAVLAAIVGLWLAARILVLTPFGMASAIANAAFPLAVAAGIAVPLLASGNRRNYFFIALLIACSAATLAFHLAGLGIVSWDEGAILQAGLDVVLFIVTVMAGRVVPMFTNNGVPGAGARREPWVERAALGSVLALLLLDAIGAARILVGMACAVAAAANAARWILWKPWKTLRAPLVWSLHAAYAWIPIHLAMRIAALDGLIAPQWAAHALTVGTIGGMTLAMMTRTALGHSGRPLAAGRAEIACYVLVNAAALVRVFGGILLPSLYVDTIVAAACLWSFAFAIYAVAYWPILTRPRIDGQPG